MNSSRANAHPQYDGSLKAICFDLDGVLIHTMPLHAQAWQEALRCFGGRVSRRWIYEREGEPGTKTARALLKGQRVLAIRALLEEKERRFSQFAHQIHIEPFLDRLLGRFVCHHIPLGLVTGTSWKEVQRVVPGRALKRFDVIVTGDQVHHGKPHPEPYVRAFARLGISPQRMIVVENSPYGIRSAKRAHAGLIVALASSLPSRYLREAHLVTHSVPRLCSVLEARMGLIDNAAP